MSNETPRRVLFVHLMGFLESMMDFGIKFEDAIKEFLDNAVDSGAENIWVLFQKRPDDGGLRILVADDGCGIPLKFTDETNQECDGIPWVMAFGNRGISTVLADGQRRTIGKFGLGLSTSIASLARKDGQAWIWTRRSEDESWRSCYFDFKDIEAYLHPETGENGYLPNESTDIHPPLVPLGDKGTILIIDIPKHRQERLRLGSMQNHVLKFAGQTYRHHLSDGLTIKVSEDKTGNFSSASHKYASISDPLCLLPGSKEVEKLGMADEYDVKSMIFDGSNGWPEYKEGDGSHSRIDIRISRIRKPLAMKILFEGVTFSGSGPKRQKERSKILNQYRIGERGQGFSLLRDKREITSARNFRLYTKYSGYNYMHGEINFTPGLDDIFTVQANKSKFDIAGSLLDDIRDIIEPVLDKVRRDHDADVELGLKLNEEIDVNPADEAIRRVAGRLPIPPGLGKDEVNNANEIRKIKFTDALEELKKDIMQPLEKIEAKLELAREVGDENTELIHAAEVHALKERLALMTEALQKKWETRQPARVREASLNHGMVYEVLPEIDEADIVINMATEFHRRVYDPIRKVRRLRASVDLMLKTLGYAEFIDLQVRPEYSGDWEDARREISLRLHQFIDAMPKEMDTEEVSTDE